MFGQNISKASLLFNDLKIFWFQFYTTVYYLTYYKGRCLSNPLVNIFDSVNIGSCINGLRLTFTYMQYFYYWNYGESKNYGL